MQKSQKSISLLQFLGGSCRIYIIQPRKETRKGKILNPGNRLSSTGKVKGFLKVMSELTGVELVYRSPSSG